MGQPAVNRDGRRAAGQLENEVLAALWAAEKPLNPAEVLEAIGSDIMYVTVLSTLIRLHERGTVERDKHGRAHVYRPVRSRAETAATDMRAMLDGGGYDGAHFTNIPVLVWEGRHVHSLDTGYRNATAHVGFGGGVCGFVIWGQGEGFGTVRSVQEGWSDLPPSVVEIAIPFARNARRDPMNYVGTVLKAVIDGLVDAGCWPDDTPDFVTITQPLLEIGEDVTLRLSPRP